jgi:RNA polymerase sigma factor (sigma-70 family)
MAVPAFLVTDQQAARLADPALREALLKFARRRLPPGEVDDLVQNTLADALTSTSAPSEEADFRRWIRGIARHKIADAYRRRGRLPSLVTEVDGSAADPGPAAGELTQWIERELPKTEGAQATLHWLLRESEGETLDDIARDAALPAPRVRQRVSRLRRHFQTRWLALGAAGLALLIAAGFLFQARHGSPGVPTIARETIAPNRAPSAAPRAPDATAEPSVPGSAPAEFKSAPPVKMKVPHHAKKKGKALPKKQDLQKPQQPLLDPNALPNQEQNPPFKDLPTNQMPINQMPSKSSGNKMQLAPTKL